MVTHAAQLCWKCESKRKSCLQYYALSLLFFTSFSTSIVFFCTKWVLIKRLYNSDRGITILLSWSKDPLFYSQSDWLNVRPGALLSVLCSFTFWCSSQVRDNATLVLSRVPQTQQNYDQNQENHEERKHCFSVFFFTLGLGNIPIVIYHANACLFISHYMLSEITCTFIFYTFICISEDLIV